MSKKGRSPIVLDILPEEVMDRYVPVSDFDDLRQPEPLFGTDLVSAVGIEETEQVDSEPRGEEEASTILFADKIDSSSPKPRSTEQERQLLGRKSHGYREYAPFLGSDIEFIVFRKFGAGNVQVLL